MGFLRTIISRPVMTTMIIGLALIESLCIYALVICFILL